MTEMRLQINPVPETSILRVGLSSSPVLVLDSWLCNPAGYAENICKYAKFHRPDVSYPGRIARLPSDHSALMISSLRPMLAEYFGIGQDEAIGWSAMSAFVSLPAVSLSPIQTLPHVDNLELFQVAGILYLFDRDLGGTGFFRQKRTGLEIINASNLQSYKSAVSEEIDLINLSADYIDRSNNNYIFIGDVEPKFNRLVIFPSALLHSALVKGRDLVDNPINGRLTVNLFIGRKVSGRPK